MKKTYSKVTTCLLDFLDKGEDNFFTLTDLYDDRDKYSRDTEYHLIAENILTQQLILGRVGTIQDMHILLTLNQMGIADIRSLARMYGKIASLNKELNMNQTSLEENIELISKRLSALSKVGYIVTVKLTNHAYSSEIRSNECYLYMVASRAAGICGNILQRRFVVDGTLFTKPVGDIQGNAVASMVASRCAYENTSFVKFENREHFYPTVKDFTVPIEMFFKKDELSHVVAFFYAYFQRDSRIHTKDTYMDFIVSKINQIIYFLNYRTKRNTRGIASVVLCVKDKEELDFVVNALSNSNDLEVALPNIYITSESILNKKLKLEQSFITLEREADGEIYYSSRKPLFID